MLEHLLHAEPEDFERFTPAHAVPPAQEVTARFNTANLYDDLPPDSEAERAAQSAAARAAFRAIASYQDITEQKQALAKLEVPDAVKELVGMLTAYDWDFVEQAKQLRGYAVAKITEETSHPDAKVRLKALELLGKVTEVALFTERHEVKRVGMSDTELDEELKTRLQHYLKLEKEVTGDVVATQPPQGGEK